MELLTNITVNRIPIIYIILKDQHPRNQFNNDFVNASSKAVAYFRCKLIAETVLWRQQFWYKKQVGNKESEMSL